MRPFRIGFFISAGLLLRAASASADSYTDPLPPTLRIIALGNAQQQICFTPYPSADQFRMRRANEPGAPWTEDSSGSFSNHTWTAPAANGFAVHRLEVAPLSSNALLTATALHKLAYGPTPELLDRLLQGVGANSAEAWLQEQLARENHGTSSRGAL